MTSGLEQATPVSIVDRAKNIILTPKAEWARIDSESSSLGALFRSYAVPLAAIGPICSAIGSLVFGWGALGIVYRPPIISVIVNAAVSYILALASVFVLGLIIDALAPNFGGVKNRDQAMKVAVYGSTASWLAAVFGIYPPLAPLAIVGLYSLYLIYLGLPRLMKSPEDKALGYTAVVIVVAVVLAIVVGIVLVPLRTMGMGIGMGGVGRFSQMGASNGQLALGGATIDANKLQAASAQLQAQAAALSAQTAGAAATAVAPGAPGAITSDSLKAMLPTSIAGFTRSEISSESSGAAGMGATHAQAQYSNGDAHMTVEITDLAAMGALGALATSINVNSSKDTATGYEHVSTANGHMTTEEYDRSSKHGKYSVMTAGRVMVEAEGDNVSIDDLKAAVSAIGPDRLAALVKPA